MSTSSDSHQEPAANILFAPPVKSECRNRREDGDESADFIGAGIYGIHESDIPTGLFHDEGNRRKQGDT